MEVPGQLLVEDADTASILRVLMRPALISLRSVVSEIRATLAASEMVRTPGRARTVMWSSGVRT